MKLTFGFCLASLVGLSASHGQILFSDNFDAGTSGSSWTAKLSAADAVANFAFDYGTIGIPSAPHSTGGSTIGLGFLVNQSAGVFQGISATPNGQSFTGDFKIQFDMWLNYNGPLGTGGSGSTQAGSFGWGVNGSAVEWAGAGSGVMFAATGDGGSTQDYRAYKKGVHDTASATYAAGSQANSDPYYTALFPGVSAPAAQVSLYPGQTGTTPAGAVGFRWCDVTISKAGNIVTWSIDGSLIATADVTGLTLGGNNLFLGMFDINATSSADPNDFLITAIFDNLTVTQVPEPSMLALSLLGGLGVLLFVRRHR